jgi:predicted  nucleic acid-binding Zn-ribbon protein
MHSGGAMRDELKGEIARVEEELKDLAKRCRDLELAYIELRRKMLAARSSFEGLMKKLDSEVS